MAFVFRRFSHHLKANPLMTNMIFSSTVGFCGDVICQTVYEPCSAIRPPLLRDHLPEESAASPLVRYLPSPYLLYKARRAAQRGEEGPADTSVLVDFRRSFIFCSFSFFFGVPYFLTVYKYLDQLIPPATITKRLAIAKGFMSWTCANFTNPIFLAYVTSMDNRFIRRDGCNGRRRLGANEAASNVLPTTMVMGLPYRVEDDKRFSRREYFWCVQHDVIRKMSHDFPDIVAYGLLFWGCNWLPMFYYIPSHFRLVYSSVIQVVWSGIMSHLLHRDAKANLGEVVQEVAIEEEDADTLSVFFTPFLQF